MAPRPGVAWTFQAKRAPLALPTRSFVFPLPTAPLRRHSQTSTCNTAGFPSLAYVLTLIFLFETLETEQFSFHPTTLVGRKWEIKPTLAEFNDVALKPKRAILAIIKIGGKGSVYTRVWYCIFTHHLSWRRHDAQTLKTDRWSKMLGWCRVLLVTSFTTHCIECQGL